MRLGKLETWSYEKEKQNQKHFQKEYIDETTGDWKEGKKKIIFGGKILEVGEDSEDQRGA